MEEDLPSTFVVEVGRRLRAIRRQQRLSLEEVEERSNGRWSASAIGAYERGYRTLSLGRLRELAEFYTVPISVLVGETAQHDPSATAGPAGRLVLDIAALDATADAGPVSRYAHAIAVERGDFNGRVLSLRRDDLRVLGTVMDLTEDELYGRLQEWGVLYAPAPDRVIDLTAAAVAAEAAPAQAATAASS